MWPAVLWRVSDVFKAGTTYFCIAGIVVCSNTADMWQWQQSSEATIVSKYTSLTLDIEYFFMSLSHRCYIISLGLFHKQNSFIIEHGHPGKRRASWIAKQSQWGSIGCQPYHANCAGTSLRRQGRNRHKYATPVMDTSDYNFRVQ